MTNNKLLTISDITREMVKMHKSDADVIGADGKPYQDAIDKQTKIDKARIGTYIKINLPKLYSFAPTDAVDACASSCENKRIDEMTLDDYRRGFNKLFNGMRLR